MPATTKQKLVEAALKRFYRDGFRNVGLDQIINDVGISKTAFYKHFECKDDLMLEVLQDQDRWLRHTFMEMIRQHAGRSARDQLRGLFHVVQMVIESEDFHGCIFVNAAMEFPLPHDPAHQAAARNREAITQIIHDIAERARATDPQALAEELSLIIEGVYIMRSVTNDPKAMDVAWRLADATIDRYLPPAG